MMFFTKFKNTLTGLTRPYPMRDWYLMLFVTIAMVLTLAGIAISIFFNIRSGDIVASSGSEVTHTPSVSRTALTDVVSHYETRLVNYNSGNIRVPHTPDPSR